MPVSVGVRFRLVAVLVAPLVVLVSCTPFDRGLGGDPCLLRQYQDSGFTILAHVQTALGTLTREVDALQVAQRNSISAPQDSPETLTAIHEFALALREQQNLVRMSARPPEGAAFARSLDDAVTQFDTGAQLLTQVSADEQWGDTRAAQALAGEARERMRQGRVLLAEARVNLATIPTWGTNC
jgi:hypothetical protein